MELARIEARLDSLNQLEELVRALRSMAASRVQEAQEALSGTISYRETVLQAIESLNQPERLPRENGESARVLLVITSDNGFVGGFNNRVMDHAMKVQEPGETLALLGRRGRILASELGIAAGLDFPMISRAKDLTTLARRVTKRVATAARARVVYTEPRKGGAFEVVDRQMLPPPPPPATESNAFPPLHHLPTDVLISRLSSEYLFAEIAHAMMESLVSENTARLMTMDSATRNIDKRLEKLRRDERIARQEQTTADILDISVGAEVAKRR